MTDSPLALVVVSAWRVDVVPLSSLTFLVTEPSALRFVTSVRLLSKLPSPLRSHFRVMLSSSAEISVTAFSCVFRAPSCRVTVSVLLPLPLNAVDEVKRVSSAPLPSVS
ncbi:hypothetical protein [Sinorhizobium medicae]|uniref:hypothetical protein n=1 Tax=Sinorhizobium medicae TaxID=110321 RepID=UPI00138FE244|nr:hypothetical protein [Sinorhizobium medicae]